MQPTARPPRTPKLRTLALGLLMLPIACSLLTYDGPVPQQQWAKGRGPVVPHDSFPADCTLCHVAGSWQEIRADFEYDHGKETGVVLHGAHASAECLRCHNDRGPVAKYAARGCAGCHEDWHQRQLGVQCDDCHDQTNWLPKEAIAKHNRTRFPLIGAHAGIDCFRCHAGAQVGNFKRADTRCASCHQKDLARTMTPDHQAAGWTSRCYRCHVPLAWKGRGFVHTTFPLTGAHVAADCTKCHTGGTYKGTPRSCESCHLDQAKNVTTPNHVAAGWTSSCERCHSTVSFSGANFVHDFWTLTGAHVGQACTKCHAGNVYKGTPTACVGCHLTDYNATTSPNHAAAKYPQSCETCHSTTRWSGAKFNHTFPLTKKHNVSCATCHTNPANYSFFNCLVCHDHNKTKMDDKHKSEPGYAYNSNACFNCHRNGK